MAGFINPHLEAERPRNPFSSSLVVCNFVNISNAFFGIIKTGETDLLVSSVAITLAKSPVCVS